MQSNGTPQYRPCRAQYLHSWCLIFFPVPPVFPPKKPIFPPVQSVPCQPFCLSKEVQQCQATCLQNYFVFSSTFGLSRGDFVSPSSWFYSNCGVGKSTFSICRLQLWIGRCLAEEVKASETQLTAYFFQMGFDIRHHQWGKSVSDFSPPHSFWKSSINGKA